MIEHMARSHLEQVVAVHRRGFQGFFLSILGPRFLRHYYEGIVDYPEAIGFVFLEGDRVAGLVCGMRQPSRFYRFLLRTRWWRFALAALGAAVRRPGIVPRLARAWQTPDSSPAEPDVASLTSIVVEPGEQGRGVGSALLVAFLQEMRARGVQTVLLTTDQLENQAANEFYQRRGFRCSRTFVTAEGRVMKEYRIRLGEGAER